MITEADVAKMVGSFNLRRRDFFGEVCEGLFSEKACLPVDLALGGFLVAVCFAFRAALVTASSSSSHCLASLGLASWASASSASGLHNSGAECSSRCIRDV